MILWANDICIGFKSDGYVGGSCWEEASLACSYDHRSPEDAAHTGHYR